MKFESNTITGEEVLAQFCQSLKTIQTRDSHSVDKQTDMAIQYFLDRFYMSRISIRMLIHQVRFNLFSVKLYKLLVKAHTAL